MAIALALMGVALAWSSGMAAMMHIEDGLTSSMANDCTAVEAFVCMGGLASAISIEDDSANG